MKTKFFCAQTVLLIAASLCLAWTTPIPIVSVNSLNSESQGSLSADGLDIYFCRPNSWDSWQLWSAHRSSTNEAFGTAQLLSGVNDGRTYTCFPWVSQDNTRLYYTYGNYIYSSSRLQSGQWSAGQTVPGLNTFGKIEVARFTADELHVVFQSQAPGGKGGWDVYEASRPDRNSSFGNYTNLVSLNTSSNDTGPSLSSDGLTLYFGSDRSGQYAIYSSARQSLDLPFGTPELISFGTGFSCPVVNFSGDTMMMIKNWDIYVSYIPEPCSLILLLLGGGLASLRDRHRSNGR